MTFWRCVARVLSAVIFAVLYLRVCECRPQKALLNAKIFLHFNHHHRHHLRVNE